MKKYKIYFAILTLILASLACQTLTGGGDSTTQEELPPFQYSGGDSENEEPSTESEESEYSFGDSVFPVPPDATNVFDVAGTVNFQTNLSLEEAMNFYRDEYGKQGLTERDLLTVVSVSDGVFSMVFDGDPSGKAVVIQGVDLGDGTTNISIRLEDI